MTKPMLAATIPLGELVDVISGFAFKSDRFGDVGDWPIIRIRDVKRGCSNTFYSGEFDERYLVTNGDLLIGMDGEFNRECWSGGKALLNQRVCKIVPDKRKLCARYLYHFLPNALKEIEDRTPFATVKHLSSKDIKSIPVPLPPLGGQRRIAAILDKADALRRKRKRALELLDTLTNSVVESSTGRLGKTQSLGEGLSFITTGGRNWSQYYSEAGSRFIRSLDVQMNAISDNEVVFVDAPDNAEARRARAKGGDVLLTVTGSRIGRVAALPSELSGSYVSQHVAILRPDPTRVRPKFLAYYLSSQAGQRQIAKWQYGQTKPGLNFSQIESFAIPDIAIEDQLRIEASLQRIEAAAELQGSQYSAVDALFSSLQHRAFSGQL